MEKIETGVYEHFKGRRYLAIGMARHSETGEDMVIYAPLYRTEGYEGLWVRPVSMWGEEVAISGGAVPRFKKIDGQTEDDLQATVTRILERFGKI